VLDIVLDLPSQGIAGSDAHHGIPICIHTTALRTH
jgi:hypothetical protein